MIKPSAQKVASVAHKMWSLTSGCNSDWENFGVYIYR